MIPIRIIRMFKTLVPYVTVSLVSALLVDQLMMGDRLKQAMTSRYPANSYDVLQRGHSSQQQQTNVTPNRKAKTAARVFNIYAPAKTVLTDNNRSLTEAIKRSSFEVNSLLIKEQLVQANKHDASLQFQREPMSVKGFYYGVYLFSAVAINSSDKSSVWDTIVLQGWEHKFYVNQTFGCCVRYKSGKVLSIPAVTKIHWNYKDRTQMPVKQYVCQNGVSASVDLPEMITLAGSTSWTACHTMFNWYLPITFAYRHENEIAVCAKLVYGKLAADDILSWFEIHRLLGVNKVMLYTYDLNENASKVLEYYRAIGMAEIIPFSLPKQPIPRKTLEVGVKNMQGWNDEQIPVYDCMAKLRGFKYMVVLDLDEYIIPTRNRTWMELFDGLFTTLPNAAGFTFLVQLHLTTWGVTNPASKFKVGQYLNSSKPMSDRLKHVTIPSRLQLGGATTHGFWPQWDKGYRKYRASPNDAVIHHFRTCRKDWLRKTPTKCDDMDRITDYSIWKILSEIEINLLKLKSVILSQ